MSPSTKIRVVVAEDSLTVRRLISDTLAADPDIAVVGEAEDGKRAIELCRTHRPDVVTLDIVMPVMSGLAATEHIMAHFPTPILIVSSSTNRGEVFKTYEALAAGAIDVLEKPRGDEPGGEWERRLVAAVKMVARIPVITHPRGRLGPPGRKTGPIALPPAPGDEDRAYRVAALGASTGGPAAILAILRAVPAAFSLPMLLVLHMDETFGASFAEWLDGQTEHRVAFAVDGTPLAGAGRGVTMAPPGRHLVVRDGRLRLTDGPERHSCRPSVDELFESLAADQGAATAACLLTGMGRDGAAGLLAIKRAGGLTLAQDEASCIIYGMPREAVLLGAVDRLLPLAEIGPALAALRGGRA